MESPELISRMFILQTQRGPLKDLEASKPGCFQLMFLAFWAWQEQCRSPAQEVHLGLKPEMSAGVMSYAAVRVPVNQSDLSFPIDFALVVRNAVFAVQLWEWELQKHCLEDMDMWSCKERIRKHKGLLDVPSGKRELGIFAEMRTAFLCSDAPWNAMWHCCAHFVFVSNGTSQGHVFCWLKSCIMKKLGCYSPTVGSFAGSLAWVHQNLSAHQGAGCPCCCFFFSLTPMSAVSRSCLWPCSTGAIPSIYLFSFPPFECDTRTGNTSCREPPAPLPLTLREG